jgi:catechol 2,3-dioxygenase-like lactoylglutathione lyase family enzyme
MVCHFRIARPVTDMSRTEAMYREGLGLLRLGQFQDHEGFDGVMLGDPGGAYHFEFTHCRARPIKPTPTPEDLLVFYLPEREEWERRCEAMEAAGFKEVASSNPYWGKRGRTFEDPDAYRVVIQCALWTN